MSLMIIAELAQGFEGRPEQARLLLRAAAGAGADATKYQLVYADELATPNYVHYALFQSLEMPDVAWEAVADDAARSGVALQFDIFGTRSLSLAERLGVQAIKLHPTDIVNRGLLEAVAASGVPEVLLGAGGTTRQELRAALALLRAKRVTVLLGFQGYPTPDAANQVARVTPLATQVHAWHPHVALGFADHAGPESPLRYALAALAVGSGATVIEKHLTLGRALQLEDHESALGPDEFAEFVATLRSCADALGVCTTADDFGMSEEEQAYRTTIRRHVTAARDLPAGTVLSAEDLVLKRTEAAMPLTSLDDAYGRVLVRAVAQSSPIQVPDLQ